VTRSAGRVVCRVARPPSPDVFPRLAAPRAKVAGTAAHNTHMSNLLPELENAEFNASHSDYTSGGFLRLVDGMGALL